MQGMQETSGHNPKVSILLPTHNRADVLPFAIRSVLGQTIQDFELLIVGDGCTDQTAQIVQGFSDPRIVWFDLPKAPNFGYANRNVALRQARGTYIAFMPHDDLWLPDHLELLIPYLEQPGIEWVYSRPLWVTPDGELIPGTFNLEYNPTLKSFLAKVHNWIPAGCVVHRRECFSKYGYWDDTLPAAGDLDMWTRIIIGGGEKNFAYLPEPTCLHFRANWRGKITSDLYPLSVWQQFHALEGFIPDPLKIPVDGVTEQEATWQVISSSPKEWAKRIRAAVRQVLDERVSHSNNLIGEMLTYQSSFNVDAIRLNQLMIGIYQREASLQAEIAASNQRITALMECQTALQDELAHSENRNADLLQRQAGLKVEFIRAENQNVALLEHQAALQAKLTHLKIRNAALLKRQEVLEASATSLENSIAWKLIRRLQTIKQRVIPLGTLREKLWLRITQNFRK